MPPVHLGSTIQTGQRVTGPPCDPDRRVGTVCRHSLLPNFSVLDQGTALRAVRGGKPGRRQAAPAAFGAGAVSHRQPPGHRPTEDRNQPQRAVTEAGAAALVGWSGLPAAAPVQPQDWLATGSPGHGTSSTARTCPALPSAAGHRLRPRDATPKALTTGLLPRRRQAQLSRRSGRLQGVRGVVRASNAAQC